VLAVTALLQHLRSVHPRAAQFSGCLCISLSAWLAPSLVASLSGGLSVHGYTSSQHYLFIYLFSSCFFRMRVQHIEDTVVDRQKPVGGSAPRATENRRGRFVVSQEGLLTVKEWEALPKAQGLAEGSSSRSPPPPQPPEMLWAPLVPPHLFPPIAFPFMNGLELPPKYFVDDEEEDEDDDGTQTDDTAPELSVRRDELQVARPTVQTAASAHSTSGGGVLQGDSAAGLAVQGSSSALNPAPGSPPAATASVLGTSAQPPLASPPLPTVIPGSLLAGLHPEQVQQHLRQFTAAMAAFSSLRNNVLALSKAFGLTPPPTAAPAAAPPASGVPGTGPTGQHVPSKAASTLPPFLPGAVPTTGVAVAEVAGVDTGRGDGGAGDTQRTAASNSNVGAASHDLHSLSLDASAYRSYASVTSAAGLAVGDERDAIPGGASAAAASATSHAAHPLTVGVAPASSTDVERALRAEIDALKESKRMLLVDMNKLKAQVKELERENTVFKQKLARHTGFATSAGSVAQ
jgi:hypothetical protein